MSSRVMWDDMKLNPLMPKCTFIPLYNLLFCKKQRLQAANIDLLSEGPASAGTDHKECLNVLMEVTEFKNFLPKIKIIHTLTLLLS